MGLRDAQAVWQGNQLYVGGGETSSGIKREKAKLYMYIHTPTTESWSHIDTPVYSFALITYHCQLVLVGGREFVGGMRDGPVTNKLWTLIEHDQWSRIPFPPMITKRRHASAVEFADNILVAGGECDKGRNIDIVEVYNGHYWAEAQYLPKPCLAMKPTVLNGHWYLMGGWGQGREVYYASLDLLVASCRPSEKHLPSVWKRLPDVPHAGSSTAVFGNRLIAVGGGYTSPSSSIYAYFPHTQSWVHVGDMSAEFRSTCTAVLPTGDLMVIGGWSVNNFNESRVHKAHLKFNGNTEL
jgi:N-acetylneuraminic acid mutarotase